MERQKQIKVREKNKKKEREREVDFSSRFHVDARIGWLLEMAARDVGSGGNVDSGRVALSERRGEDLVIPKGVVERDSPVSSHHSDALYLLCHPFVIVLDERDASLAATDFLIDRGYFPQAHTRILILGRVDI